jgi:hypothetical protein
VRAGYKRGVQQINKVRAFYQAKRVRQE